MTPRKGTKLSFNKGDTVRFAVRSPYADEIHVRTIKAKDVSEHWAHQPKPNESSDRAQATFDHLLDR